MEKQRMSSDEWVGRLMTSSNPDPLLYDLVVGGATRREARKKYQELIEGAYTSKAKAWNRLSDMTVLGREVLILVPQPIRWSRQPSGPDEAVTHEPSEFRFRQRQQFGSLCERWELMSAR